MVKLVKPWAVKYSLASSERELDFKNLKNDKKNDDIYIMKKYDNSSNEIKCAGIDN